MNDNMYDNFSDATTVVLNSEEQSSVVGKQSKTEQNITMPFFDKEETEVISWSLQRQAELRTEMIAFYKKDFTEILQVLSDIELDIKKRQALMRQFVGEYQQHWESAFSMLDLEK